MSKLTGVAFLEEDAPGKRALSRSAIDTLQRARRAGVSASVIARELHVSRRTVYRYLDASFIDASVGCYRATFLLRPGQAPIQATPWEPEA